MRITGTTAYGVRLPVIGAGDPLPDLVAEAVSAAIDEKNLTFTESDIVAVTEAVVAKSQSNYAALSDIGADVRSKFGGKPVGVVFPIFSRNRFLNILKGIAEGAEKVFVLLSYPQDEVGNPLMELDDLDEIQDALKSAEMPITAAKFNSLTRHYAHPFTGVNYPDLYREAGGNIEVWVSNDPRDILKLTGNIIVAEIHSRFRTKARLERAGAENVITLSDILSKPINGSGYNERYGVLGSNLSTGERIKLFPRDCGSFINQTRKMIFEKTGVNPEVMIYGDGAFKDPACGIWELADPVVSPAYTERLGGRPNEIKLKFIADNLFGSLTGDEKTKAVERMIREKGDDDVFSEGTTPRKYADLLGSLCDLMSGSGDKGTPVILIQGYFDNYATE